MTMATKREVLKEHLQDWLRAKGDRRRRREITELICRSVKLHPKSVPRAFRRLQLRGEKAVRRGRPKVYGPDVTAALKVLWDAASEPCGDNLHPLIPEYTTILRRDGDWKQSKETTRKLLAMSLGTVKKRVSGFKRMSFLSHGKSTTSPGVIHGLIPVRSGPWDEARAGTMQIDTVAHCGGSTAGDYVFTVNSTDVAMLWGVRRAQWNKGQTATVRSMEAMDKDAPFPIIEWHPDSGSEFINWHCLEWSQSRDQQLTRSRPNHKNDNCFVEERNGHVVRRYVGYARFDAIEMVDALNALYDVLTPYLNHFSASRRTVSKERIGARWKVARERTAQTPFQRLLARTDVADTVKVKLKKEHEGLNPLVLKREIDRRTKALFTLYERHRKPSSSDATQ